MRPVRTLILATAAILGLSGSAFANIAQNLHRDLQVRLNLTHEQAAGLVGNLATETGNFKHMQEIDPVVEGSAGGWGYAQWTGPRRRQFETYADGRGLARDSYEANLDFLVHEFNTTERAAYNRLLAAGTTEEAAYAVMDGFLRPGVPHWDSRRGYAEEFANGNYNGSGVAGPGTIFGSGFAGYEPPATPIDTYTPEALMPWKSISLGSVPPGRAM